MSPHFRLERWGSGSGFPGGCELPAGERTALRPADGAMEKLRRVLSGQDDEEQGLTSQVTTPRWLPACWPGRGLRGGSGGERPAASGLPSLG